MARRGEARDELRVERAPPQKGECLLHLPALACDPLSRIPFPAITLCQCSSSRPSPPSSVLDNSNSCLDLPGHF